jgi:outer membrane lipoprotein
MDRRYDWDDMQRAENADAAQGDGRMRKHSFVVTFAALLAMILPGCASPVSPQLRQEAAELSFRDVLANPGAYTGTVVIWGGVIARTVNHEDRSDLYLSETPRELSGRPRGAEESEGEFIARTSQVLDPGTYAPGRKVTVAGEIIGQELGSYHGAPYAYPVVKVKELHLWEEAPLRLQWMTIPYYSPYRFTPQQYQQEPPLR